MGWGQPFVARQLPADDLRLPSPRYREQLRAMVLQERDERETIVDELCAVRQAHRFFRAHPDPTKRPDFMECACGAMIPILPGCSNPNCKGGWVTAGSGPPWIEDSDPCPQCNGTGTDPWDSFERHRVDQMLMALDLP